MNQEIMERPSISNGSAGGEIVSSGGTIQQVRSSFCTAVTVQKPRNLPDVKRKLMEEARLMGEDAYYGWGAGKNAIEGPSIDLAVAAARCWGNCATDMLPVQDLHDCWIFTAAFVDLETGYTRTRQFRQSKGWTVHGKLDEERKEDLRFQIGQSKAERNVILKALPSWLINAALEAAKEGVRAKVEAFVKQKGLPAAIDIILRALNKCGVKEPAIIAKCGVAEIKGLTVDHLVVLRGDLQALQSGQERVEVLFPAIGETASAPHESTASHPGETEPAKKQQAGRKVTKKTLALLNDLATKLQLTPVDKEELCAQANVQTFEELSDENAASIIHDLAEVMRKREEAAQPQKEREPGEDEPDEPTEE